MDYDESTEKLAREHESELPQMYFVKHSYSLKRGRLSARESLAIALRALEKAIPSCGFCNGYGEIECKNCEEIRDAIAEITKRRDYIQEGKGE